MGWPDPMLGPTWIVVAQHVPFLVGAARLVSRLAFTDLRHVGSGVCGRACVRVSARVSARVWSIWTVCPRIKPTHQSRLAQSCRMRCAVQKGWCARARCGTTGDKTGGAGAHSDVRLGLAQNAAGSSAVSALFPRSMLDTAGSNAIAAGTVPTKRFRCKALRTAARTPRAQRIGLLVVVAINRRLLAYSPVIVGPAA